VPQLEPSPALPLAKGRMKSEKGFSLIEVSISVMVLALLGLAIFCGLATSARATLIMDEGTTANDLAYIQMEHVKSQDYAASYLPAAIPDGKDYVGYSANITAESLPDTDDVIQKITVEIEHNNKVVTRLEAYKVNR